MKKANFEILKEMFIEDIDELIFLIPISLLIVYLFFISKITLAIIVVIVSILLLIIYRRYSKKNTKITKDNKRYYEFLGKLLYIIILLNFLTTYGIGLFRITKRNKDLSVALFYPRLILLIVIILLLLWLLYLLKKQIFRRELLFSAIGLIAIYESLIFFVVYSIYESKPTDLNIGHYLLTIFNVAVLLWLIWIDANINLKNDKTQPKILSKKQAKQ